MKSKEIAPPPAISPYGASIKHTKTKDTTECIRCKSHVARDTVYSCPGCGRGTPIGERILHCLEHCAAYMSMMSTITVYVLKMQTPLSSLHLLHTHSLQECNMKNEARFVVSTIVRSIITRVSMGQQHPF